MSNVTAMISGHKKIYLSLINAWNYNNRVASIAVHFNIPSHAKNRPEGATTVIWCHYHYILIT